MKDDIMQKIGRAQLLNPLQDNELSYNDHLVYDKEDLLNTYLMYQEANKSNVTVTSEESLICSTNDILRRLGATRVIYTKNTGLNADDIDCDSVLYDFCVDDNRDELFSISTSIIKASVAVASFGVVGIVTGNNNPRLASLVVSECIIMLDRRDIVPNFFEAFKKIRELGIPTNLVFLAGPSRTADIELQTVFGVHGPQTVEVLVY